MQLWRLQTHLHMGWPFMFLDLIVLASVVAAHRTPKWSGEKGGAMPEEPLSEPVCVVIAGERTEEDAVRRCLGDSLPLRVVSWQNQDYLGTITALRPQVIVIWGAIDDLVHERCQLLASLFSSFAPTVISAIGATGPAGAPHLMVQQLGIGARVRIAGLRDVHLP